MAQSMSTDVIVNVYIGTNAIDPNAVSVDITSVIMPGISEDNPAELELYDALSRTLRERATHSSDYPQLERLLGEHDATIQPTTTGISISCRQYQQTRLNADPTTYYERSLVARDLAETILQNIFRTIPVFRGMTFDICYTYGHRLKLEQQLYDVLVNKQQRYNHMRISAVICILSVATMVAMVINTGHFVDSPDPLVNTVEWVVFIAMAASGLYAMLCNVRIRQYHQQLRRLLEHLHTT